MDVIDYVAARIKQLRTTYGGEGLSQESLGKELKVATNTISRWETTAYKPSINDLEKLARFFQTSILTFFPEETNPVKKQTEALLRAAENLPQQDIEELRKFAEFRQAQSIHKKINKKIA